MKNKLENLIKFDDFDNKLEVRTSSKTKRTETGLDILNEKNIQKYDTKIDRLIDIIESGELSGTSLLDRVINDIRDALVKMEQNDQIEPEVVDDLDELHDGEWEAWIIDAVKLVPEKTISNILDFLGEDFD